MEKAPGIYLEITEAIGHELHGKFHSYLIYRKPDGTNEVIRGGFDPMGMKISVETRKSLEESKDALEPGEKRESEPLPIPPKKLKETWVKMRDKAEEIGKAGVGYRFDTEPDDPDQTSNSVVRAALDEVGVPVEKALPDGVDPNKLPGIRDNLAKKIEEAQREQDRPNPIEGEIGGMDDQIPAPTPPVDPADSGVDSKPQRADFDAGDADLENASPEAKAFMSDLLKPGRPVDEIRLKRPEDLTESEVKEIMIARMDAPTEDERQAVADVEKAFFDDKFGTDPAEFDARGRMIEPEPKKPINKEPVPIRTADGRPLEAALKRIGRKVIRNAETDGFASAVRGLQGGLNILDEVWTPPIVPEERPQPRRPGVFTIVPRLKEDGVFGPKTRMGLKRAVIALGAPKVEEGIALGRLDQFARDGRKEGFGRLGEVTEGSFGPLFRDPRKVSPRPTERAEAVTLQETLNDLGKTRFARERFPPLKLDGAIGPKTIDAFGRIASTLGPARVTRRFGEFLGFL